MNEVKFNTQICTTREQSEQLLAIGLKPETADCILMKVDGNILVYGYSYKDFMVEDIAESYSQVVIPAWSLHRLIELLPQHIHLDDYADTRYWLVIDPLKVIYKNSHGSWIYQCDEGGLYDKSINTIEWTIKNNHFNKEYLKQ